MIRRPPAPQIARAVLPRQAQKLARARIAAASDAAAAEEGLAVVANTVAAQFEEERDRMSLLEQRVGQLEEPQ